MKKILFFFALLFIGAMTAFAQVPVNEQLTYQTVVRNAQNQLVFSQNDVSVLVEVCNLNGSVVRYSETHTGLSTNANGLLTLMVGGGTHVSGSGEWADIDWSDAAIRTTITYNPGTGTVTIPSGLAPVTAVPFALQAGNASGTTINIGDAIHDSIVNNISSQIHDSIVYNIENTISEQIHDSITNYLTVGDYVTETDLCTTIEANCTNVALRNGNTFTGDHDFTEANSITVPNAIVPDLATVLADTCNQKAVNLCDLLAVFDSLCRRIEKLENAIPPVANAPTVSNVTSTSMNVKANATSQGAAITSYEFCYSTNSDMSGATCKTVPAADADNVTFTGLTGNTDYYVQYSATNFAGTTSSPVVQQRTPAHTPTADVSAPTSAKPAGFKVEVTDIDPKEKTDETSVQVCYTLKTGTTCPEKESVDYADCKTVDATGVTDTTISVTGLTLSTEYCVIVKVSNGDSTTIYGPYTVTTGADVTMTISGPSDTNRCGAETIALPFMATITGDDANDFTYEWSAGTSTTALDTVSLSNTTTITVTATHTTEGYTLTATKKATVSNNPVSIGFCESDGVVSVKSVNGAPNSIEWGDGQSGTSVSDTTTHDYAALGNGNHEVTITASNAAGCTLSRTMTVTIVSTVADRTVKPCNAASMGSHAAQTSGIGNTTDGLETVNASDEIVSVKDYDGNEYPVVQIGSQCWTAVNLRTAHYADGSAIPAGTTSDNSTTDPYYYDYSSSNIPLVQRGYHYNWTATMKNTNTEGTQGVCPTGWHVPTKTDLETMIAAADASPVYLSSSCHWSGSTSGMGRTPNSYANPDRNKSGFSAVPAGVFARSSFHTAGTHTHFWSSTAAGPSSWDKYLVNDIPYVRELYYDKSYAFSVRCLRD